MVVATFRVSGAGARHDGTTHKQRVLLAEFTVVAEITGGL
jgi:hypothetical protein